MDRGVFVGANLVFALKQFGPQNARFINPSSEMRA